MNTILASMQAHPTYWALGSYYVFSNAISSLPTPSVTSSGFYRWAFDFSHLIAGNVSRVIATRYPQLVPNPEQNQQPAAKP